MGLPSRKRSTDGVYTLDTLQVWVKSVVGIPTSYIWGLDVNIGCSVITAEDGLGGGGGFLGGLYFSRGYSYSGIIIAFS